MTKLRILMKTALVGVIAALAIAFAGPAFAAPSAEVNPDAAARFQAKHAARLRAKQIIAELRAAAKAERRAAKAPKK